MAQKWNLQDIRPVESRPERKNHGPTLSVSEEVTRSQGNDDRLVETLVIKNGNKERSKNYIILAVVAILVVGGLFGVSALVSKTTLTVYPEYNNPTVNAEFTAYPEKREGQLTYEIMTLTEKGEAQVKATGQETVQQQAKGTIEIIKSTPGTERLIKNTRFRSPDGHVFRIQESVVVPGAIKDTSGALVPGTIRAEVFADQTGPDYNLPAGTRFDIPGFKESKLDDLYNSIYAENHEAFTGGFDGPKFTIDENELATAKQGLEIKLRDSLLGKVKNEQPADFIAFSGAVAITYNDMPTIKYGDDLVTIQIEAVLQQPLFKKGEFASYIAEETIETYNGAPVRIVNPNDLSFEYTEATTSSSNLANASSLKFKLTGKPEIVWEFNAEQLKSDLAGKSLTALSVALSAHTGIKSAEISKKPFWKRDFPNNKDDIVIIEKIGKKS